MGGRTGWLMLAGFCALLVGLPVSSAGAAEPKGAKLVRDIAPGTNSSGVSDLAEAAGAIYFSADDVSRHGPVHGTELWTSNGTRAGTRLVRDISPGRGSSYPTGMTANASGVVFFWAGDRRHGTELWRTDGTKRGTKLVRDILPGRASSNNNGSQQAIVALGNYVYFAAQGRRGDRARRLWRSDGTVAGTAMVPSVPASVTAPSDLTRVGSSLFFVVDGFALWRLDDGGAKLVEAGIGPEQLTAAGRRLYFVGYDEIHNQELWTSDGTAAGTVMVEDISPDFGSPRIQGLTAAGGRVFFAARSQILAPLWTSDGTAPGTSPLTDASGESLSTYMPESFGSGGRTFYFVRYDSSGTNGSLWASDGTPAGTRQLRAFRGIVALYGAIQAGRLAYFTASGGLWVTDGSPRGTRHVSRRSFADYAGAPAVLGERLFFAGHDQAHDYELWATYSSRSR